MRALPVSESTRLQGFADGAGADRPPKLGKPSITREGRIRKRGVAQFLCIGEWRCSVRDFDLLIKLGAP
jgi:hypothetical protein